ncbi:hypothetical protein [Sporosarcina sp. P7]|uniref:hypothetical protein n=1 Tax=Sporosarcina sp. P7 TaxID=2048244 RepID=UPI000C172DCD|nr:hypothetical protein [Sporosarcina sp. P7]PID23530.1 hypothetical protein CSV60_14340 [Sporosarcina sp. P7]
MARLKVGDVFEVDTTSGKAYIQYVLHNEVIGDLVRVLSGVYDKRPENLIDIINVKEEYFVHFPVKAAKKRKIVELVSNFELPKGIEVPTKFRTEIMDKDGNLIGWHIVDYDTWQREKINELSEGQKMLSPWGTWNDTLLIERISQEWTLENWG